MVLPRGPRRPDAAWGWSASVSTARRCSSRMLTGARSARAVRARSGVARLAARSHGGDEVGLAGAVSPEQRGSALRNLLLVSARWRSRWCC